MESGGVDLASVLLIVFIILKLCGVINWSWLWVLSPFWISIILYILFIIIIKMNLIKNLIKIIFVVGYQAIWKA